ncbi:hypothetical protein NPIL_550851, partial [Nephila pilipes]
MVTNTTPHRQNRKEKIQTLYANVQKLSPCRNKGNKLRAMFKDSDSKPVEKHLEMRRHPSETGNKIPIVRASYTYLNDQAAETGHYTYIKG